MRSTAPSLLFLTLTACTTPVPDAPVLVSAPDVVPEQQEPPATAAAAVGIQGAWTVEVREADGTLVERRSFHNALGPDAYRWVAVIAGAAAGHGSVGEWRLTVSGVDSPTPTHPCGDAAPASCACIDDCDGVTVSEAFPPVLTLTGHITATRDGEIARVRTEILTCVDGWPADDCFISRDRAAYSVFSEHSLDTPIAIAANQSAYLSVEITFSSVP